MEHYAARLGEVHRDRSLALPMRNMLITLCLVATVACGVPSDSEVEEAFKMEHPTYTIVFVGVGEGDGSAAYFHIKYKRPGDDRLREDIWQYLDTGGESWVLNHKESVE